MKYLLINILLILTLSSCSIPFLWSNNEDTALEESQKATKEFKNDNINLLIPTSWKEIWASNLPIPKSWNITLALRSADMTDWIYRTMVILEDTLLWKISSEQYARNDYKISVKKYSWFRELSEETISFNDGVSSKLYTFEAKYNPDSPRMKFLQSSKVCSYDSKNVVYNITIALPSSAEDLAKYEWLIKTISCNKKEA